MINSTPETVISKPGRESFYHNTAKQVMRLKYGQIITMTS